MATDNKIYVGIDDQVIELTGAKKVEFLAQRALDTAETLQRQSEAEAKTQAKAELLERLGITADEAKLLLE